MKRVVVKMGGHALTNLAPGSQVLEDLARDVLDLRDAGTEVVVVHGGGPQIGQLLDLLGRPSSFHEGLRVTDDDTMDAVAMALALVNLQLVAALVLAGLDAVGLTGVDGALLTSTGLGAPWGRVGAAPVVRPTIIEHLWSGGVTPVVCSVAPDSQGHLLNVNADAVAGALAGALGADALILMSDVDQVLADPDDPASALDRLNPVEANEMVATGRARDGMRPKLVAALDALSGGALSVTLANGTRPHALAGVLNGSIEVTEVRA